MSRPVRDRIVELELDVRQVRLAPAAAVRARGSRRARRRLVGLTVAVAALVTAGGFAVTDVVPKLTTPGTQANGPVAGPVPCPSVDLQLPDDPANVEIRVFAGARTAAQAAEVAEELGRRRFSATSTPGTDPAAGTAMTVAVVRYGPSAVGTAAFVRTLVLGEVVMKFDSSRKGRAVDLVLGVRYQQLATATEINRALAEAGEPTVPPQCQSTPGR